MNQDQKAPSGFIPFCYERSFRYSLEEMDPLWRKLQLRETFTKGQIFPYRVEFSAASQEGEFAPGELNIHHGPLLSVHGAIGEVSSTYRSLDYFYGSYVLSFRLVRPVKLEFSRQDNVLIVKLSSYVRSWFLPFWRFGNFLLWSSFRSTIL